MKDFKLVFTQKSPLTNSLSSDTIFGAFFYYLFLEDEEKAKEYHRLFVSGYPPFIVSSLIPYRFLPFLGGGLVELKSISDREKMKRIKKIEYLNEETLPNLTHLGDLPKYDSPYVAEKRVYVNLKGEESLPYGLNLLWIKSRKLSLYLRILKEDDKELIIEQLKKVFLFGIGKKFSVGLNHLEFESIDTVDIPSDGDYFINLSAFIPQKQEADYLEPVFYQLNPKYPRHGLIFGQGTPFKKKIFYLKEGSLFKAIKNKSFYGVVISRGLSRIIEETLGIYLCYPYFF